MPLRTLSPLLFCLFLLFAGLSEGGLTNYSDPGKTDFDTVLQVLNPYGTWSKIDGQWAYTPLDHLAPYTNGRWIYTEFGWYWKGRLPHSWATEHYGYWKRGADKVWSWYPGPYWLPQIVEIRASDTHLGWRSAAVDNQGNFIEKPIDRYTKPDEWTFVTLSQFANPITPALAARPDVTKTQLEESTECRHTYLTYREIDRPGPHPADFFDLCKDGGMLAPKTLQDELAAQAPPPSPVVPGLTPGIKPQPPKVAAMTGTNAPSLVGAEIDPTADTRKVKYWITMSLPSYWSQPPSDAKPEEIYLYRPDFYQDNDGIQRRITLWFNPQARVSLKEALSGGLSGDTSGTNAAPKPTGTRPAAPAEPAMPSSAFQSPLDEGYHPSTKPTPSHSSTTSSKSPAAPSGAASDNAPIPPPLVNTNAAPVNAQ